MKKVDIVFDTGTIEKKDILSVYVYEDYYIAKYQFYTTLSYNFGQQNYKGWKTSWGVFNKETFKNYFGKDTKKACKKAIDRLVKSGKKYEELEDKEHYRIIQSD